MVQILYFKIGALATAAMLPHLQQLSHSGALYFRSANRFSVCLQHGLGCTSSSQRKRWCHRRILRKPSLTVQGLTDRPRQFEVANCSWTLNPAERALTTVFSSASLHKVVRADGRCVRSEPGARSRASRQPSARDLPDSRASPRIAAVDRPPSKH